MRFREPEVCPNGHGRTSGNVIDSRVHIGPPSYRRRRHRCNICEARWTSYQSLINPLLIKFTHKHVVSA